MDRRRTQRATPSAGDRAAEIGAPVNITVHPAGTDQRWPAIRTEQHPWTIPADALISNAQRRRINSPYEAAITPPIAELTPDIDGETRAAAEEAIIEITRFDAEFGSRIVPFSAILLRSESAASSRIEQLTASAKAIALAELDDDRRNNANAALIVSNVRAMEAAIDMADRLDLDSILAMHAVLLEHERPEWAGHWRTDQVWIGGSRFGPHGAMFVPPRQERVPAAMADLVAFAIRDDVPALVHAAIAHAQFETIHPFPDGNGRTGRALIHAMLRRHGVTRNVTVPISAGLLVDTDAYFSALGSYRSGELEPIVAQIADAAFSAILNARHLLTEIDEATGEWASRIKARSDSAVWPLIELLVRQPAVTAASVTTALGVSKPAALNAIDQLEGAGVLIKAKGEERNRAWVAIDIVTALDRFAERGGRRSRFGR